MVSLKIVLSAPGSEQLDSNNFACLLQSCLVTAFWQGPRRHRGIQYRALRFADDYARREAYEGWR